MKFATRGMGYLVIALLALVAMVEPKLLAVLAMAPVLGNVGEGSEAAGSGDGDGTAAAAAEEFDVTKAIEGLELTDAQYDELASSDDQKAWIEKFKGSNATPAKKAGESGDADPKPAPAAGAEPGAKGPDTDTPPATPSKETPASGGSQDGKGKFAGKYATEDDLKAAIKEAGKTLGYNPALLERLITTTKEVKDLEAVYKDLEKEISSKPPKPAAAEPGGDPAEVQQQQKEIVLRVVNSTLQAIRSNPIADQLRQLGHPIPPKFLVDPKVTQEYMTKLKEESPVDYLELKTLAERSYGAAKQSTESFVKSLQESDEANVATIEADKKAIRELGQQLGIPVTEDSLNAFVDDALKIQSIYEEKNGVPFIKKDSLYQAFYWKNREAIEKAIRLKAAEEARVKYDADMAEMTKRSAEPGITAAGNKGTKKPESQQITPESFGRLSDEEQDDILKKLE